MLPVCRALTATALEQNLTAPSWTLLTFYVALEEAHVPPLLGCNNRSVLIRLKD